MKIGLMTFPNSWSHGASLQMYALYTALVGLGHEVEVINYFNETALRPEQGKHSLFGFVRSMVKTAIHHEKFKKFRAFEKYTVVKYPSRPFSNRNALSSVGERYDCAVCGSDQVWNPNITGGDLAYFLNFCSPQTKRVAYAPSFGLEHLPNEFSQAVKRELSLFTSLSVREEKGCRIIKDLIGQSVPTVLDPTFLLSRDAWQSLERSVPYAKGEYVLYYTVSPTEELYRFCEHLSTCLGMKIILVGGNVFSKNTDRLIHAYDIAPDELLYLIHHAAYIVTNSFHGLAFSIQYQKNFYINLSSQTNSRLEQLLGLLDLEDRVIGRISDKKMTAPIDYSVVQEKLTPLREASLNFLKNAIK